MSENLGLGVMIEMLRGNEEAVKAIRASIGKTIGVVVLNAGDPDCLEFTFTDGSKLSVWDNGQSCCEKRYMTTGDRLEDYAGAQLLGFEVKNATETQSEHGEPHEIQFLDVQTSKGVFQMSNHNEHNGYYGGFAVTAKAEPSKTASPSNPES